MSASQPILSLRPGLLFCNFLLQNSPCISIFLVLAACSSHIYRHFASWLRRECLEMAGQWVWGWVWLEWVHVVSRYTSPDDDDECGRIGGVISMGYRSTRRIPALKLLCQPQIPHELNLAPRWETSCCTSSRRSFNPVPSDIWGQSRHSEQLVTAPLLPSASNRW
jgi:hypothetical protein